MSSREDSSILLTVSSGILGLLPALAIFGFSGFSPLNISAYLYAGLGGFFLFGGRYMYFKALKAGDMSDLAVLNQLTPLFVFLISVMFLSQVFSGAELVGFILMFLGGVVISFNNFDPEKMRLEKATLLILASVVLYAITDVFLKISTNTVTTLSAYAAAMIGAFVASVVILVKQDVRENMSEWKDRRFLELLLPGRIFFYLGFLAFTFALQTGKVALVTSALNIRPIFVIAAILGLRKVGFDYLPEEDMSRKANTLRIVSVTLFAIGIYFLSY